MTYFMLQAPHPRSPYLPPRWTTRPFSSCCHWKSSWLSPSCWWWIGRHGSPHRGRSGCHLRVSWLMIKHKCFCGLLNWGNQWRCNSHVTRIHEITHLIFLNVMSCTAGQSWCPSTSPSDRRLGRSPLGRGYRRWSLPLPVRNWSMQSRSQQGDQSGFARNQPPEVTKPWRKSKTPRYDFCPFEVMSHFNWTTLSGKSAQSEDLVTLWQLVCHSYGEIAVFKTGKSFHTISELHCILITPEGISHYDRFPKGEHHHVISHEFHLYKSHTIFYMNIPTYPNYPIFFTSFHPFCLALPSAHLPYPPGRRCYRVSPQLRRPTGRFRCPARPRTRSWHLPGWRSPPTRSRLQRRPPMSKGSKLAKKWRKFILEMSDCPSFMALN